MLVNSPSSPLPMSVDNWSVRLSVPSLWRNRSRSNDKGKFDGLVQALIDDVSSPLPVPDLSLGIHPAAGSRRGAWGMRDTTTQWASPVQRTAG